MKLTSEKKERYRIYALLTLAVLAAYTIIWMFTTRTPFMHTTYCSYALQADRWLHGHLDLGQDYPWLELAIYNGKYFVSFPPLPTFFVLPFVLLFGVNGTPEYFITVVLSIIGVIYVYKLFSLYIKNTTSAVLWSLLASIGSNFLLIGYNGDVWLMAQTAAYMFTAMSFYYALTDDEKDGKWPLIWLACAVGCRPINFVYCPIILILLYMKFKKNNLSLTDALKKHWKWLIAPAVIGIFYMVLNLLRFDNPFQFGHDFLPVNTRTPGETQFGLKYFGENFKEKLFGLPKGSGDHRLLFSKAGFAFYLVSPVFLAGFVLTVKRLIDIFRNKVKSTVTLPVFLIGVSVAAHLIILCLHSSMGGIQWGLRYTVDAIPAACVGIALIKKEDNDALRFLLSPIFIFGLMLNTVGTLAILNDWSIFL